MHSSSGALRCLPMMYADAHLHLVPCGTLPDFSADAVYAACTCAHDRDEFWQQQEVIAAAQCPRVRIVSAFGIHPQNPAMENVAFLEARLRAGDVRAVGEAGFDLFTPAFAARIAEQEAVWQAQVALAAAYDVPLIVHCRKGMERLFRDAKLLRAVRAVVFHSFAGSPQDARSLVRRGINAFFSFGKPLLNGKKSAIACVRELPAERLLLETDAPFQTLKGEARTDPADIARVYRAAAQLKTVSVATLAGQLRTNFFTAFGV